jgi:hypothetical protein
MMIFLRENGLIDLTFLGCFFEHAVSVRCIGCHFKVRL